MHRELSEGGERVLARRTRLRLLVEPSEGCEGDKRQSQQLEDKVETEPHEGEGRRLTVAQKGKVLAALSDVLVDHCVHRHAVQVLGRKV